jgi:hypothetical protein
VQTVRARCLILAALFAPTAWLVGAMQPPAVAPAPGAAGATAASAAAGSTPTARWPSDDATYAVPGWTVGDADVERLNGNVYLTRTYARDDGTTARFTLTTAPSGKTIYRAGADVPYLGTGYTVEPAPAAVTAALAPGEGALVARGGGRAWLQIHAYGERRGLLGNGPAAWGWLAFDLLLGHQNAYYLARLVTAYAPGEPTPSAAVALAEALFPRIQAWYAAALAG